MKNIFGNTHIIMLFLIVSLLSATAQPKSSIIAGVDSTGKQIIVKWFSEQVIFHQGVHVYRSEAGNDWIRLTTRPLKKGDMPVAQSLIQSDYTLQAFIEATQSATNNDLKGIIGAMLMVKAVQNNHYARFLGLCYIDNDVAEGVSYRYRVMQVQSGGEIIVGETNDITAGHYFPAAPPRGLTITAGDGEAKINWTPEPERFFGVNIYRQSNRETHPVKANHDMILISEHEGVNGKSKYPDVFFTDKSLNNNYQYTYFIRSIDYLGQEGLPSEPVTIAPQDKTPPEPPTKVSISVDGLEVSLFWANSNPSHDLEGYHVYRSKRMNSGYVRVNKTKLDSNTFTFIDRLEDPGQYFYYVAAVDSASNESVSLKDMADVKDVYPPTSPRGLVAQADSGSITLRWIANHEKDLMGYQVFRTVEKNNPSQYVLLNSTPQTDTVFVDKLPVVSKNKFYYKVAAIDSSFNRSEYSEPTFGTMPDLIPPARPHIKVVSQLENALLVEWLPNVEEDLKSYNVYRVNMNDLTSILLSSKPISQRENSFTDLHVKPNVPYRYYVTATDSSNNISLPSEYFYAVFIRDEVSANNPLSSFRVSYKNGQKQATLKWKLEGKNLYRGVVVYRSDGASFKPISGLIKTNDYTDKDIEENENYTYRLHLFLNSGAICKSEEIKIETKTSYK